MGKFSLLSLLYSRFGIAFCIFITIYNVGRLLNYRQYYRLISLPHGDNNQCYMLCYMFFLLFFFSSTIVCEKHDSSDRPIDTYIHTYIYYGNHIHIRFVLCVGSVGHGNHVMLFLRFNLFDFNTQQDYHHHQYNNITNFYPQISSSNSAYLYISIDVVVCCVYVVCVGPVCVCQYPVPSSDGEAQLKCIAQLVEHHRTDDHFLTVDQQGEGIICLPLQCEQHEALRAQRLPGKAMQLTRCGAERMRHIDALVDLLLECHHIEQLTLHATHFALMLVHATQFGALLAMATLPDLHSTHQFTHRWLELHS